MAIQKYRRVVAPGQDQEKVLLFYWDTLALGDEGKPLSLPANADVSIHAYGTFSTATLKLRGTNQPLAVPTQWATLSDPNGNDLLIDAADQTAGKNAEQVLEHMLQYSPIVVSGDGSTAINVYLLAVRP